MITHETLSKKYAVLYLVFCFGIYLLSLHVQNYFLNLFYCLKFTTACFGVAMAGAAARIPVVIES